MSSNYVYLEATSQVKPMAAKLKGLFISAASSTPTITVYDSATASSSDPVLLATFTPVAGNNYNFFDGVYANKGLYIVISGTVKCTVYFE